MPRRIARLLPATLALVLAACASAPYQPAPSPGTPVPPPVPAEPGAGLPPPAEGAARPPPPPAPAPRSYRLGAATSALVTQARSASDRGDFVAAAATLERALRIEPDNPLVWIEMGRMRLASGDAVQAQNMGQRALALSAGAPREQSAAWRLVADALRLRGRNAEAQEAARRAEALMAP